MYKKYLSVLYTKKIQGSYPPLLVLNELAKAILFAGSLTSRQKSELLTP